MIMGDVHPILLLLLDNMKCSPVKRSSLSLRFLVSVVLFGASSVATVNAQVPAIVTRSESDRQDEKNIHVQWDSRDESKWHDENDGRLDIMSLKTHICTELLQPNQQGKTVFQLTFDHPCTIECLIQVNVSDPTESIYLYDQKTGDLIADLKPNGKKSFLTPSFDPETTEIIWNAGQGVSHPSDITIENIYYNPIDQSRAIGFWNGIALSSKCSLQN